MNNLSKFSSEDIKNGELEKVIVLMIDVQKTLNGIDDENAKLFMKQVAYLRDKFEASKAIINISSHTYEISSIKKYTDILERNLENNIEIDTISILGAIYHYNTEFLEIKGFGYNVNKTATFEQEYLNSSRFNILWFGIFDDECSIHYIDKFREKKAMIVCRPSKEERDVKYNNLMCYSTVVDGFDGVVDGLSQYIENVKNYNLEQIMLAQLKFIKKISNIDIIYLTDEKCFDILIEYIDCDAICEDDYKIIVQKLAIIKKDDLTREQLVSMERLISLVAPHLEKDNCYLKMIMN